MGRNCQRAIWCPSNTETIRQRLQRDAVFARPFAQRLRNALEGHESSDPTIGLLFSLRGPAAISRLIVFVVVDAFDRCVRWSRSHICVEQFERVFPAVAHRDAAASVVSKLFNVGIEAAALGSLPTLIFSALIHPVFGGAFHEFIEAQTSAGLRVTRSQTGQGQVYVTAAGAFTENPPRESSAGGSFGDKRQPSVYGSRFYNESRCLTHTAISAQGLGAYYG